MKDEEHLPQQDRIVEVLSIDGGIRAKTWKQAGRVSLKMGRTPKGLEKRICQCLVRDKEGKEGWDQNEEVSLARSLTVSYRPQES